MTGTVFLVGAGPGNRDLLTIKAQRLLARAEVVVYDRLAGDIISLIPDSALKIDVGKQAGNHPVPQPEIIQILIQQALSGRDVIRLKGGDCFLFGRGGEELAALAEHQIPFEVVPGIPSAIAAPAYAGIPVTDRSCSSSLHIITGHRQDNGEPDIDYAALVKAGGTQIFMMSVKNLGKIADGLLLAGMSPDTPCAIIENGTLPKQRKFLFSLRETKTTAAKYNVVSPAIFMVGPVCSFSETYDWFSALPLKGLRVLVTRPVSGSSILAEKLLALGADVTIKPLIRIVPLPFALPDWNRFTGLVFTSANGVSCFFDKLLQSGYDARILAGKTISAVGSKTAHCLQKYGICADFVPDTFSGEALAKEMLNTSLITARDHLLLVQAKGRSPQLAETLSGAGIFYSELFVYETQEIADPALKPDAFDVIPFTSAGCVDSFVHSVGHREDFSSVRALCIGPQTQKRAQYYGMKTAVSKEATIESMIELMITGGYTT